MGEAELAHGSELLDGSGAFPALSVSYEEFPSFRAYARAMVALMAGGGVRGGQVVGATDAKAQGPVGEGFTPDDLAASFFKSIGIDPKKEYAAKIGRPITLVRDGEPIEELFA